MAKLCTTIIIITFFLITTLGYDTSLFSKFGNSPRSAFAALGVRRAWQCSSVFEANVGSSGVDICLNLPFIIQLNSAIKYLMCQNISFVACPIVLVIVLARGMTKYTPVFPSS